MTASSVRRRYREADGSPRWIEDPTQRVEDVSRVIDYAVTLPNVDENRIGVIEICGGGGYAINATLTEKRIKAVVSITGVNLGRLFREGFSNYDPLGALHAMAAQRTGANSSIRGDNRTSCNLAVVQEVVSLAGALEREVFEQHLDLACLREADDLHEFRDRSPIG